MSWLAIGYLALLSLMWLALVLGVGGWGKGHRLARAEPPEQGPRLSICIPARNEARNIQAAVRAALAVQWPDLQVVVVDDDSEDGTGDLARQAGDGDPRLLVAPGTERDDGWSGKAWACRRAAELADGEWLLFLDADVVVAPQTPAALWAELDRRQLALLSAFGSWELVTFWEQALIPVVGWFIRGAVDLQKVNDPLDPTAFANGQLIAVRRADYDAVGGHGAVRAEVLDDVRLAEAFARAGKATGLTVAPWAFRVRLYRSLSEIVDGYTKNLYEGMGRQRGVGLAAIAFILAGTIAPVLALPLGWWAGPPWGAWLSALVALQLLFRFLVERRDGRSGAIAWTHPLGNLLLVWILARSVFGRQASWKGRAFVGGKAS